MPSMSSRALHAAFVLTACALPLGAQTEKVDQAVMQKIRSEGFDRSKIMETASWLTDVYGPRLTGSPNTKKAGDWTIQAMKSWGCVDQPASLRRASRRDRLWRLSLSQCRKIPSMQTNRIDRFCLRC